MKNLIVLPDRSPMIPSAEWSLFVSLSNDIRLAEKILAQMRSEYRRRERDILQQLKQGARIENGGKIAS